MSATAPPVPAKLTREYFRQHAAPIKVVIDGAPNLAVPKEFSTKSLGWNINGKGTMTLGGIQVQVQIGLNLTIIGSKEVA